MEKSVTFNKAPHPKSTDQPWYYRGYLQHYDDLEKPQSITFRLYDAVPRKVVENWKIELNITAGQDSSDPRCVELRRRIAKYEDAGYGECWLKCETIAGIVEGALHYFDNNRYQLIAWCIMPNHVHVLFGRQNGYHLKAIQHSWKSFTAKRINEVLIRSGNVWDTESYDRFVRNETHLQNVIAYIENNPVTAGLANAPWKWTYSSARHRRELTG